MLKVTKFGGSSLADARQFQKVKDIVQADGRRVVVVVSAPASGSRRITRSRTCCICAMPT